MTWQPIETAPKDGTEIIVLVLGHAVSAKWISDKPGYEGSGWLTLESREGFYHPDALRHWMPFTLPPEHE